MKQGENGRGIGSRWYPQTLAKRIRAIAQQRHRLTCVEADAFDVIEDHLDDAESAFFADPPYTAGGKGAGRRLYGFNQVDHERLFRLAAAAKGPFMLTYDDSPTVRKLARINNLDVAEVRMKSTHHAKMTELAITN